MLFGSGLYRRKDLDSSKKIQHLKTLRSVKFVDSDVLLGHTADHSDYVHV